jgi:hypothetical protein
MPAGRAQAGTAYYRGLRTPERQFEPFAAALSWVVSDTDGGVTRVRRMCQTRKYDRVLTD